MKEIKFRAWDITRNALLLWDELRGYDLAGMIDDPDIIIEQYTGLHDKNGKEIYEGDVLTIWCSGYLQENKYIVEDMRELYPELNRDDMYLRITEIEVIGNIHETSGKGEKA